MDRNQFSTIVLKKKKSCYTKPEKDQEKEKMNRWIKGQYMATEAKHLALERPSSLLAIYLYLTAASQSVCPSVSLAICLSACMNCTYPRPSVYPPIRPPTRLSTYPPVNLPARMPTRPYAYPSVYPPVCLPTHLPTRLSNCTYNVYATWKRKTDKCRHILS